MSLLNGMKNRSCLFIVLVAAAGLAAACGGSTTASEVAADNAAIEETAPPATDAVEQVAAAFLGTSEAPVEQGLYQGAPVGFTDEGYPYLGDPDAPVTLEEYSDFLCPFCQRHFQQTWPALFEEYVKTGQVKYVFRDMPLVSLHPTAPVGHAAARCVADQGAARFWGMHDALFARQNAWSQLPDPSDFVARVAEGLGVDMTAYQECMASGEMDSVVEASVAVGRGLGFNGTPSFQFIQHASEETYTLIGARPLDNFSQWLDALVAGEVPPQEQAEAEPPELPFWANAEGLAPDPERPGYTLSGDQYKGNPEAPVVVIEFGDFQCPSCQRHALDTQPTLDAQFVDTGEIMWVFKHLPLREHPQAPMAAVAAECAAAQGSFWEMHHQLFESQEGWATDDVDTALLALGEELELDMAAFSTCFNSRSALERVLEDMYDAQGENIRMTPSFVVLFGGRGSLMSGARSADQFVTIVRNALDQVNSDDSQN